MLRELGFALISSKKAEFIHIYAYTCISTYVHVHAYVHVTGQERKSLTSVIEPRPIERAIKVKAAHVQMNMQN